MAALALSACNGTEDVAPDGPPNLSTPRSAITHFLGAARSGHYESAAKALDLRGTRLGPEGAARAARRLQFALDQELWLEPEDISNDPEGTPEDGRRLETVGVLTTDTREVPIQLIRYRDGSWHIHRDVVNATPALYRSHGGWLGENLPEALFRFRFLEVEAWQWIGLGISLLLALLVGGLLGWGLRAIAVRIAARTRPRWDDYLVQALTGPGRVLLGLGVFALGFRLLRLSVPAHHVVFTALMTTTVVTMTWLGIRLIGFAARLMEDRLAETTRDPLRVRGARTQVMVLRRVLGFGVLLVGASLVLMQYDAMRTVGASVLASAGVLGIVVGIAAQRSIGTLIAGIQLSITQPIRVGDVIILDDEWGTIEEVNLSYVVVKTWDLRRLVVPITRFLDEPFQNWTKTYSGLMGTVFVHTDYGLPVDALREELERFLPERREWDGDVCGVQVTEAGERNMQIRVVVSAAESGGLWDLRCAVREHVVSWLQTYEGGRYLPVTRVSTPNEAPRLRGADD